jgi:hypothetical protein
MGSYLRIGARREGGEEKSALSISIALSGIHGPGALSGTTSPARGFAWARAYAKLTRIPTPSITPPMKRAMGIEGADLDAYKDNVF